MNNDFFSTMKNLNGLLSNSGNNVELLNGIINVAGEAANAKGFFLNQDGKLLAGVNNVVPDCRSKKGDANSNESEDNSENWFMDQYSQINQFKETQANVKLGINGFENFNSAVFPVENGGALVVFKPEGEKFTDEEVMNVSLCANNAGIVSQQEQYEASANEKRKAQIAHDVLESLSFTEIDVVAEVFDFIKNGEGFVIASKIADKNGYARSVTVNALRKLESAGVITTRSLGVKGTYIKILNDKLLEMIPKFRKKKLN